jgi:hypothetical protein
VSPATGVARSAGRYFWCPFGEVVPKSAVLRHLSTPVTQIDTRPEVCAGALARTVSVISLGRPYELRMATQGWLFVVHVSVVPLAGKTMSSRRVPATVRGPLGVAPSKCPANEYVNFALALSNTPC